MWKRYLVELGTGADLHGMDQMEAATRAVKDAVSHCCMSGFVDLLGITDLRNDMRVVMRIAAPNPAAIDPEPLKKLMITKNVDVEVVQGGMMLGGLHVDAFGEGDQIVVVNAGLTVYARVREENASQDTRPLNETELSELRAVLGKEDLEDRDWETLESLLPGKLFYTAQPVDPALRMRYSELGILKINGEFVVFTSEDAMQCWFTKMGEPFVSHEMAVEAIPWERIAEAVTEAFRNCLIDPHLPQNDHVLGYSGDVSHAQQSHRITVYSGRTY